MVYTLTQIKAQIAQELNDTIISLPISEIGYQETDFIHLFNASGGSIKGGIRIGGGDPGYANGSVDLGATTYFGIISKARFLLRKVGAPTGTAYCRIRDINNRILVESTTTLDVSTLTTSFAWKEFVFSDYRISDKAIKVLLEYEGGDASNKVQIAVWASRSIAYAVAHIKKYDASDYEDSGWEPTMEIVDTATRIWSGDEIEDAVKDALRELSLYVPNIVKETLTTTATSKDLDISSIADLIYVSEVEYEVGKDPRRWRNFTIRGNTLTIEIDFAPSAGQSVELHCAKPHILTDASSTLSPELERIIVLLASARLAVSKGAKSINAVTTGGGAVWQNYQTWGERKMAIVLSELKRLVKPKIGRLYATDR